MPAEKQSIKDVIEAKLSAEFAPTSLEVIDESHLHAGHPGNPHGHGETHFRVKMTTEKFNKTLRVARHRAVNDVLSHELENGVHALALELSPTE